MKTPTTTTTTADIIAITVDEARAGAYARTIARAARKLEELGLGDEAAALRAFASDRIEAARATARASNPALVELAARARATRAAA